MQNLETFAFVLFLLVQLQFAASQKGTENQPYAIPDCDHPLKLSGFRFWDWHKGAPEQGTTVHICVIEKRGSPYAVNVTFDVEDNWIDSNFTRCHERVYLNDSVEFFFTPQSKVKKNPELYMQFDINPYSALLPIYLNNTCGICNWTCIDYQVKSCDNNGIIDFSSSITGKKSHWKANMVIKLDFIHDHTVSREKQDGHVYRANFFRIDSLEDLSIHHSAWRSTNTTTACFHVPRAFGYFTIGGSSTLSSSAFLLFATMTLMLKYICY